MKQKKKKGGVVSMLLGTLGTSLLGKKLSRKRIVRAGCGNKQGKGVIRASYGSSIKKKC